MRHPRSQFQMTNALFLLDMFDIIQRHEVNHKTRLYLKCNPHVEHILNTILEPAELTTCMNIMAIQHSNPVSANQQLQSASVAVRTLQKAVKTAGGYVIGSPQIRCTRSKLQQSCHV